GGGAQGAPRRGRLGVPGGRALLPHDRLVDGVARHRAGHGGADRDGGEQEHGDRLGPPGSDHRQQQRDHRLASRACTSPTTAAEPASAAEPSSASPAKAAVASGRRTASPAGSRDHRSAKPGSAALPAAWATRAATTPVSSAAPTSAAVGA